MQQCWLKWPLKYRMPKIEIKRKISKNKFFELVISTHGKILANIKGLVTFLKIVKTWVVQIER
jgi:hypothetical protein